MHALARRTPTAPVAPPLRAVEAPARRPRPRYDAWDVARFAAGLTIGFLLAAVASAPGGGAIVAGQLVGAVASAAVGALAALRWRRTRARHPG